MVEPDSLPAELLSSGETAVEDEAGADRIEYATTVLSGQGIAAARGRRGR